MGRTNGRCEIGNQRMPTRQTRKEKKEKLSLARHENEKEGERVAAAGVVRVRQRSTKSKRGPEPIDWGRRGADGVEKGG